LDAPPGAQSAVKRANLLHFPPLFFASNYLDVKRNFPQIQRKLKKSGAKWSKVGKHHDLAGQRGGAHVFLGAHAPKLDDKGRVILPAKFREELASGIVVTRGQENCLYVFTAREFESIHEKIRQAPVTNKVARDFLRVFLSGASAETPDKQNRISIPANLRQYAGLTHDLAVIGAGNRVEIWDALAWDEYLLAHESAFSDTDEEVIPGLF
jgi:MraZ protein